jgi:hypothetical protein
MPHAPNRPSPDLLPGFDPLASPRSMVPLRVASDLAGVDEALIRAAAHRGELTFESINHETYVELDGVLALKNSTQNDVDP